MMKRKNKQNEDPMNGHENGWTHHWQRTLRNANEERTNEERNVKQTKDSIEKSNLLCDYFNLIFFQFFFVYFFSRLFFITLNLLKLNYLKQMIKMNKIKLLKVTNSLTIQFFNENLWYIKETQTFVLFNLFYSNF